MGTTLREIIYDIGGGIPERQEHLKLRRPVVLPADAIPAEYCWISQIDL